MLGKWKREYNRQVEINRDQAARIIRLEQERVGVFIERDEALQQVHDKQIDNNALNCQVDNCRESIAKLQDKLDHRDGDVYSANRILQSTIKGMRDELNTQRKTLVDAGELVSMLQDVLKEA